MFGGGQKRALVGLDIGSSSIKAVELKSSKQGYELMSFGLEALAQDTVVDGAIMDAPLVAGAISNIFENAKDQNQERGDRGIGPLRHRQKSDSSVDDGGRAIRSHPVRSQPAHPL